VTATQKRSRSARPVEPPQTILDAPLVTFGRAICGDLEAGLCREWLVTNGLGGYASGTLNGITTRRYHGLLVAALEPPVARTVLVASMVEQARYDGESYGLSTHEFVDGTITTNGYVNIEAFMLQGSLPVWSYALADALLERRLWMSHGANTTYLSYRVERATADLELDLTPLLTQRSFHSLAPTEGWNPAVDLTQNGHVEIHGPGDVSVRLIAEGAEFQPSPDWYWNVRYREEAARGLDAQSDLFTPGTFRVTLRQGDEFCLVMTSEMADPQPATAALIAEQDRERSLLEAAGTDRAEPTLQQLTLAADQFIVERHSEGQTIGKTIIAGYHWFNDWGRDTMISLPGLALTTNRPLDAADILRTFARYIDQGLLPNNFPDSSGTLPGYNTADATLWYAIAIHRYHEVTDDETLVDDLLPALQQIVQHHIAGTKYGIGVDPQDGLLRAGEPGVQLTWMDAKVGDWVVTPRMGKPVEINALWYNVLRIVAGFLVNRDPEGSADLVSRADHVRASFQARFLDDAHAGLADVVDTPNGDDWTTRPNQLFAISLPHPLVEGETARTVLESVTRALITSFGPRSLAAHDPAYRGDYGGDQLRRDGAYHQGPVWSWLTGSLIEASLRVYGSSQWAQSMVRPFTHHLSDAGLGSISEIMEGAPPHLPRGCVAQAWSVAEVLRVWRLINPT
jgi:predicted glycogen debranching enzyme